MDMHLISDVLLWCLIINYGILLLWFGIFSCAHDWLYRTHSRWFKLSPENFDAMNYMGIAIYKIGVIVFNLVPWLALCIVL